MAFKEKLSYVSGVDKDKLPSSYQILGDVLLFKLPKLREKEKKKAAGAVLRILPYVKTVCEIMEISGEFRRPAVKKLIGNSTETVHKENGILYKLDVTKVMFSKGNLSERKRLLNNVREKEVVVDMFAGIGYFSIPLAAKVEKVYSIEKSRISFEYLKENIRLNEIRNIKPILGDCTNVKVPEKIDRVLMGYFPGTQKFLPAAFGFLKDKGTIHYHDVCNEGKLGGLVDSIKKTAKKAGFKFKRVDKKKVKGYAPGLYHYALDCEFVKLKG